MDFTSILTSTVTQLRDQLANVEAAIAIMERVESGGKPKRGRPPGSKNAPKKNRGAQKPAVPKAE